MERRDWDTSKVLNEGIALSEMPWIENYDFAGEWVRNFAKRIGT
jgi:hypothetical protein